MIQDKDCTVYCASMKSMMSLTSLLMFLTLRLSSLVRMSSGINLIPSLVYIVFYIALQYLNDTTILSSHLRSLVHETLANITPLGHHWYMKMPLSTLISKYDTSFTTRQTTTITINSTHTLTTQTIKLTYHAAAFC